MIDVKEFAHNTVLLTLYYTRNTEMNKFCLWIDSSSKIGGNTDLLNKYFVEGARCFLYWPEGVEESPVRVFGPSRL